MAANNRFTEWLDHSRENISRRKEQSLLEKNRLAHRNKETFSTSNKVVESFLAPPPFLMYVWATFPLLFFATLQTNLIIAGIAGTVINLILIHMDTFQFFRFLMCGFVLLVIIVLYQLDII